MHTGHGDDTTIGAERAALGDAGAEGRHQIRVPAQASAAARAR